MPGSSLWLLPPKDSPINSRLAALIEKTSQHFNSPHRFLPHVTLTSNISSSTYGSNPQGWLEKLNFPPGQSISVVFEELTSEDVFVRKLYIKCIKQDGLLKLAATCREIVDGYCDYKKAEQWAATEYNPHLSLMYHDCPVVDKATLEEVNKLAREFEIEIESKKIGWKGGRVVLVPTDKPIEQWNPIAMMEL